MTDLLDLILNNTYFHLVAVIALGCAFAYAEVRFRQLMKAIKEASREKKGVNR